MMDWSTHSRTIYIAAEPKGQWEHILATRIDSAIQELSAHHDIINVAVTPLKMGVLVTVVWRYTKGA